MLHEEDHPYTDVISSPIAEQLMDFYDDGGGGDLFAAVTTTSDTFTTSSEDGSSSSITMAPGPCSHGDNTSAMATGVSSACCSMPSFESTLSALLEEDELADNDGELLHPIECQYASVLGMKPQIEQQEPFDQLTVALPTEHPALQTQMSSTASELTQLTSSVYSGDCLGPPMGGTGGYVSLDEAMFQPPPPPPPGASLLFPDAAMQGGCFLGKEAAHGGILVGGCSGLVMPVMGIDEIGEYQRVMEAAAAGALIESHIPDAESVAASMPFVGNAGEIQTSMSQGRLPATTTETSSLEDTSLKNAGRISVEERRKKIHKYIKKRNERNFSKKIKYACRKTLADSRPRVRGRFAKNDDYGEPSTGMQNHEEYEQMGGVKEEDMLDDLLQAHMAHQRDEFFPFQF